MAERRVKPVNRKPSFFWQGVLILAPVLVLAKLGALAISQDKRMARHEAELRAQDIAEQAADLLSQELQRVEPVTNDFAFDERRPVASLFHFADETKRIEIDTNGWLVSPAPFELAPMPHVLDIILLTNEQRTLWETALTQRATNAPVPALENTYYRFIASSPPTNFLAVANLALGDVLMQLRMYPDAEGRFYLVTNRYSCEVTEGGLPVGPLAIFKKFQAFQARNAQGTNETLYLKTYLATLRLLLAQPSAVTPELLRELVGTNTPPLSDRAFRLKDSLLSGALREWEDQEQRRKIYADVKRSVGGVPGAVVITRTLPGSSTASQIVSLRQLLWASVPSDAGHELWLVSSVPNETGATLLCRPEQTVTQIIARVLQRIRIPEYLEASVRIAGVDAVSSNSLPLLEHVVVGKGGGQFWKSGHSTNAPAILASAERYENGRQMVAVGIHLISPDLLYARQEERATLFTLLTVAAGIASFVGFFTAWRAFHKQLRLAELKSNFVSSVSHELRAPIASVRLMAEGLERGKVSDPAKQHEYFRFITQECRRLSSMIENVLDFARIEQGRKQYEFEPTDVIALVEKTVKLMEPYAAERGVKLLSKVEGRGSRAEDLELVNAAANAMRAEPQDLSRRGAGEQIAANIDGQAIQQALVNLIDNAIKHSPGGSEVTVSLAFNSQPSTLNLSVSDHGPGIPATEHEKIFERFYQIGRAHV